MDELPTFRWFALSLPKVDNAAKENEDAIGAAPKRLRFAIADGASEAWQSGSWARHLVRMFLIDPPGPGDFLEWLDNARKQWQPQTIVEQSWYAEAKRDQGSYATLIGIEFRKPTSGSGFAWKAMAVGDSCLLIVRGEKLMVGFPLSSAAEFGSRPSLLPSSPTVQCPDAEWLAGRVEAGDLVLLVSDALARHLLGLNDKLGSDPLLQSMKMASNGGETASVRERLAALQASLNDDASVVAIEIPRS